MDLPPGVGGLAGGGGGGEGGVKYYPTSSASSPQRDDDETQTGRGMMFTFNTAAVRRERRGLWEARGRDGEGG